MSNLIRQSVARMTGYTPGEQPGDSAVIKLNTNENPYPPSPAVGLALAAFDYARLRLYPDPLASRLRARIAELHGCSTAQVFVGNGSDEVLELCTRAFVENDGSIGYFEPSYSLYPVLAEIRDAAKRPVELGPDFEWCMPDDYACSLFFLTNPNAPTGLFYEPATVRGFCERSDGTVLIDEAYVDFSDTNCLDLALGMENVIVARTLSKSYSLAGIRVGYAIGAAALIEALYKVKDSYNLDAISQQVALAALSDTDHMGANVAMIRSSRERLSEALRRLGFAVVPSQSNFVFTRPAGISAESLFAGLKARNILIRYFPGERTGNYVRITIGTDREIDCLLEAIAELIGS